MAKYVYPAVFAPAAEGGYVVTFPDWEGATQGDTVAEAIEMAADFLGLAVWTAESNAQEFPAATDGSARCAENPFRACSST